MFFRSKKNKDAPAAPDAATASSPEQPAAPPAAAPPPVSPSKPAAAAASAVPAPATANKPGAGSAMPLAGGSVGGATALGKIVSLLTHSKAHQDLPISGLQSLVMPALTTGQFIIAEAKSKDGGKAGVAAFALWACVSPEVDQRLMAEIDSPVRLQPGEWKSGDIVWLVEAVGEGNVLQATISNLLQTTFAGRTVKVRRRGPGGKFTIQLLKSGGEVPAVH